MERGTRIIWAKAIFWSSSIVALGFILLKYATPDSEKLLKEMSPDVRRQVEENKELRMKEQEELMKIVKKTAASKDPIWKTGPIKSPWDPDYKRTAESSLVSKQKLEKMKASEEQKAKLAKLKNQQALTEDIEKKDKATKRWFRFW